MAARSIASLTVSFGLVSIPVKLYSATQARASISFNLLHAKDGSRLRQQYVCIKEDVVVERDDMIKGYEFAKDQYVTFTAEELRRLKKNPRVPSKSRNSCRTKKLIPSTTTKPTTWLPTRAAQNLTHS